MRRREGRRKNNASTSPITTCFIGFKKKIDREVGTGLTGKAPGGDLEAELAGISAADPRVLMDWLHSLCGGEAKTSLGLHRTAVPETFTAC
jgi:hypothetical protein